MFPTHLSVNDLGVFVAWDHALSLLALYVSHLFPLEPKKQRSKKKKKKKKNNAWSQVSVFAVAMVFGLIIVLLFMFDFESKRRLRYNCSLL